MHRVQRSESAKSTGCCLNTLYVVLIVRLHLREIFFLGYRGPNSERRKTFATSRQPVESMFLRFTIWTEITKEKCN